MTNVLWLSNHPVNADQLADLQRAFGEFQLTELPPQGKVLWGSIDPRIDFYDVGEVWWDAFNLCHTGNLSDFDAVVVMGELSLCLAVTTFCTMEHVSVYTPTTERLSQEIELPDGSVKKTTVFNHVQLRCLHLARI